MMQEETVKKTQFDVFNELNTSINASVYVTPDGAFGANTADGRVMSYTGALVDITDISTRVSQVEIHTQKEPVEVGKLFIVNDTMHQCIKDDGASIKAFRFADKAIVEIVPETLKEMGDVRAIGVVYLPESAAFGGDMFKAAKMLAAASGDRDALRELRRKEWRAAQMKGETPKKDGLDEMLVFSANPGAVAFQTLIQQQQQTAVLASLADSLRRLVDASTLDSTKTSSVQNGENVDSGAVRPEE